MPAWAIIREARARAGLTQRALAARAGKAQSEIAKIERGRRDPTVSTLERLVRAAGCDLKTQFVLRIVRDGQDLEVAARCAYETFQRPAGRDGAAPSPPRVLALRPALASRQR